MILVDACNRPDILADPDVGRVRIEVALAAIGQVPYDELAEAARPLADALQDHEDIQRIRSRADEIWGDPVPPELAMYLRTGEERLEAKLATRDMRFFATASWCGLFSYIGAMKSEADRQKNAQDEVVIEGENDRVFARLKERRALIRTPHTLDRSARRNLAGLIALSQYGVGDEVYAWELLDLMTDTAGVSRRFQGSELGVFRSFLERLTPDHDPLVERQGPKTQSSYVIRRAFSVTDKNTGIIEQILPRSHPPS